MKIDDAHDVIIEEIRRQKDQGTSQTELQAGLTDLRYSAYRKYQELIIGSKSLTAFLKYEILTGLLGPLPGAVGLVLRKQFFRFLFGRVGRNVIFGKSITIRHPHKIHIANNVVIDDYVVLDAKGNENKGIVIGSNVMIGRNSVISCKNGNITIGENTNIAMNCLIQSAKEVYIGRNVLFAPYCYVIGGGDHQIDRTDIPIIAQEQVVRGIAIEDNCWIGAGTKILDGIRIGRDSIVGAGAVVIREVPEFSIVAGIPAKMIRKRDKRQARVAR